MISMTASADVQRKALAGMRIEGIRRKQSWCLLATILPRQSSTADKRDPLLRNGTLQYCKNKHVLLRFAPLGCSPSLPGSAYSVRQYKCKPNIHLLINRRMYFKERERSSLYKRQQQLEQARLAHKLEEIKSRKLRGCDSENRLPAITHRLSQPRPCQKAAIDMETQRLAKRILQLKTNKSQYFQKVIGVNLSLELPKRREEKPPPHGSTSHLQESK